VEHEHNPDPVTEFVRERLRLAEKEGDRGAIQKIERASGLGSGHVFRIKDDDRQRVTSRTAQALAPVIGWADYGDFLQAVVTWWKEEGQKRIGAWAFADFPEIAKDAELRVAIDMTKGGGGTSPEIVADALEKFRKSIATGEHDRFWWVARFGESAQAWQKREAERVTAKKAEKKATRELTRARKEAPSSARSVSGAPPSENEPKPSVRRRQRA
jgi:hypothetical protein